MRLPIWEVMKAKAGAEENALVQRHTEYVLPLMESYVNTFPTYTLHNREHIYNVIRISIYKNLYTAAYLCYKISLQYDI